MPPPAWVSPLKDLPNKVQLPPQLEQSIRDLMGQEETAPGFAATASSLADELTGWLDAELAKLTEQRIALGDSSSLKQRLLGDPRRQVDQSLAGLKARFQAERGEWTRRLQKQQAEVLDSVELELRKVTPETRIEKDRGLTDVPVAWRTSFPAWIDSTLSTWGQHLGTLLPAKLKVALEPDLELLSRQLGEPVEFKVNRPAALNQSPAFLEFPQTTDNSEVPTTVEAFFETFKNGLNTVAMLAGLVVIPVVGSFSDKQPQHVRAGIITALVLPIIAFAVWQTFAQRKKLIGRLGEKVQDKIKKTLEQYAKTRVERHGKEADRHVGNWLSAVQGDLLLDLDAQISSVFGRKEAAVAGEIAKVAIQADRLQDQIGLAKQARSMVTTSFAPEARRRATQKA